MECRAENIQINRPSTYARIAFSVFIMDGLLQAARESICQVHKTHTKVKVVFVLMLSQ